MITGLKEIKGYNIYKEGTWCEVTKDGKHIYSGSVKENMTHEDIYRILTAKLEFRLNGKALCGYSLFGSTDDEKQATLELLAYENNCNIDDIEVVKIVEEI